MIRNYGESVEINRKPNWPYIPDHPYRILIIGGPGSGKTNVIDLHKKILTDIDQIYLYVKDQLESKYQLLIKRKRKSRNWKVKKSKSIH